MVWCVWCEVLGGEKTIFPKGSAILEPMNMGWTKESVEMPEAPRREAKRLTNRNRRRVDRPPRDGGGCGGGGGDGGGGSSDTNMDTRGLDRKKEARQRE